LIRDRAGAIFLRVSAPKSALFGLLLAVAVGVPLGLGAYTFAYAEGTSYLGTDPKACANCHIMWPQFDSWQKASHHTSATCVDCHLPASGVEKYVAKAVNGFNHSRAFTFQDFPEPIRITPKNAEILQDNCLRCHGDVVHEQVAGATTAADAIRCVHCHFAVGHGPTAGLGCADRGLEREGGLR
jgi:cytochrome c nitrite reductase small subunit